MVTKYLNIINSLPNVALAAARVSPSIQHTNSTKLVEAKILFGVLKTRVMALLFSLCMRDWESEGSSSMASMCVAFLQASSVL